MPDIIIAILAVLFVFGIAINIHEFGHFIVGKMLGMRIEAYSFFGIGKMIWKFRRGNTDYGIAMFPIGAYVKFYGDEATSSLEGGSSIDANIPKEELFEFRPRWQKFLVMLGGPFMNIILALAIPFGMALTYGVQSNPAPIVGVIKAGGAAEKAGLKVGDRIVSFEGVENPTWRGIRDDALLIPEKAVPISVERNGERLNLTITPSKITESGQSAGMLDFEPDAGTEPVVVGRIDPSMPAAESDLKTGDWVVSINGQAVRNSQEMRRMVGEIKDQPIKLLVNRNGERKEIETRAKQSESGDWLIGIRFDPTLLKAKEKVGISGAITYAWEANWNILRMTAKAFGQVGTGERSARDTVSGPIGIVQIIAQMATTAGFEGLLFLLGVISLNLGIMNLLPIPMLDGGQIVLLGVEKVLSWFNIPLSMGIKEKINLTGFAILMLLMVFTTFNDISRFFR